MVNAPPTELVTRLRGKPPKERALQVWARLRDKSAKPEALFAIVAAVHCLFEEQPQKVHATTEFRQVGIAKRAHALAGGLTKIWELQDNTGRVVQRTRLQAFANSSGLVLRHLGRQLEAPCELAVEKHLAGILALKQKRDLKRARHGHSAPSSAEIRHSRS